MRIGSDMTKRDLGCGEGTHTPSVTVDPLFVPVLSFKDNKEFPDKIH